MNALSQSDYNALRDTMRNSMPEDIGKPDLGKSLDILNRGTIAGTLGGPVDLATMLLAPFGYNVEKPVMGSEWIGDRMQDAGMVSGKRYPAEEMLASFIDPFNMPLFMAHKVYHGSPHLFDKFDASKIGTGEGAQAYGHGLYFAENPKTASWYKENLSDNAITYGGKKYSVSSRKPENIQMFRALQDVMSEAEISKLSNREAYRKILNEKSKAIDDAKKNGSMWLVGGEGVELAENKLRLLQGIDPDKIEYAGNLYTADIPDEWLPRMLDWDKPLSEQGEEVRRALMPYFEAVKKDWSVNPSLSPPEITGQILSGAKDIGLTPELDLSLLGIPGIRYLDGSSRGAGHGTYNYVIFPGMEDQVKILERNGKPVNALAR